MELSVRDWMIIIGVLLIVAVLLDGYRRMRDPNRIRVSLTRLPEDAAEDDDPSVMRELPNGGARVKPRADDAAECRAGEAWSPDDAAPDGGAPGGAALDGAAPGGAAPDGGAPRGAAPGGAALDGAAPDGGAPGDAAPGGAATDQAAVRSAAFDTPEPANAAPGGGVTAAMASAPAPIPEPAAVSDDDAVAHPAEPDPLFDELPPAGGRQGSPLSASGQNLDLLAGLTASDRDGGAMSEGAGKPDVEEVLILHVVARDERGFPGEDILEVLLAYNLRFGEMNFFHRHEESAGRGPIQFSVANMLNPGVFDIDAMCDFSTRGLIFFLSLPGPRDMMAALNLMFQTAQGVAENLGGDVLDESRSALTRQTQEHMRQRVRDLERKLLATARR